MTVRILPLHWLLLCLCATVLLLHPVPVSVQHTPQEQERSRTALAQAQQVAIYQTNLFREKEPLSPLHLIFGSDEKHHSNLTWHIETDLLWEVRLSGPARSTPLIVDLYRDGAKQVLVAAGGRVEGFDARTGRRLPAFNHGGAGPVFVIAHDISEDGREEVVTAGEDGQIKVWHESGWILSHVAFEIPHLPVPRDWFEGLEQEGLVPSLSLHTRDASTLPTLYRDEPSSGPGFDRSSGPSETPAASPTTDTATSSHPFESQSTEGKASDDAVWKGFEGWLPPEGVKSLDLFLPAEKESVINEQRMGRSWSIKPTVPQVDAKLVVLDPHILARPVVRDVDGDGVDDLLVAVSYYLSPGKAELQQADGAKYAASAITCFNLPSTTVKWHTPLDLSFADRAYSPYIYESPSVGDIEGDGNTEIVVGTGLGMLYVLEGKTGMPRSDGEFPLSMDSIRARMAIHDVDGNGNLDIIANDNKGNLAVFNHLGKQLWSTQFPPTSNAGPSLGDINGDGQVDIVLATEAGHIFAWNAKTGETLKNFPIRLEGRIYSRPLLLPQAEEADKGLLIIVTGDNGMLYIVHPLSPAIDRIDLGHHSFGMILADDLLGNAETHLVVACSSGRMLALTTSLPLLPLAAVRSHDHGRMGGGYGIYYEGERFRQVNGRMFKVPFRIIDNAETPLAPYHLTFAVAGKKVLEADYAAPGAYTVELDVPAMVSTSIGVELVGMNKVSEEWHDSFTIQCNVNFARTLKWLVVVPFLISALVLYWQSANNRMSSLQSARRGVI